MQTYLTALNIWTVNQIYSAQGVPKINSILSSIYLAIYGSCVLNIPIPLISIKDYVYLISFASSKRKNDLLDIVYGYVMMQWYALYVLQCSYELYMYMGGHYASDTHVPY